MTDLEKIPIIVFFFINEIKSYGAYEVTTGRQGWSFLFDQQIQVTY